MRNKIIDNDIQRKTKRKGKTKLRILEEIPIIFAVRCSVHRVIIVIHFLSLMCYELIIEETLASCTS